MPKQQAHEMIKLSFLSHLHGFKVEVLTPKDLGKRVSKLTLSFGKMKKD